MALFRKQEFEFDVTGDNTTNLTSKKEGNKFSSIQGEVLSSSYILILVNYYEWHNHWVPQFRSNLEIEVVFLVLSTF